MGELEGCWAAPKLSPRHPRLPGDCTLAGAYLCLLFCWIMQMSRTWPGSWASRCPQGVPLGKGGWRQRLETWPLGARASWPETLPWAWRMALSPSHSPSPPFPHSWKWVFRALEFSSEARVLGGERLWRLTIGWDSREAPKPRTSQAVGMR